MSSFVKIVDFLEKEEDDKNDKMHKKNSKDYCYMPETYDECQHRFGIIFCDNLKVSSFTVQFYCTTPFSISKLIFYILKDVECHEQKRPHAEKVSEIPIEEYPFTSVNRVRMS